MGAGEPAGQEVEHALRELASTWAGFDGSERSEAQSFLNQLLQCFGQDRRSVGARFEHNFPGVGFADMFWPGNAVIEMKKPSEDVRLESWQVQAEKYWRASAAPDRSYPAVRYVVLCSFRRFVIWDMHVDPSRPAGNVTLADLPDQPEALLFLRGPDTEPSFVVHHRQLTTDAAAAVAEVFQSLKDRSAAPLDEIQRFTMQTVWVLFAEDLGMLTGYPFQVLVDRLRRDSSQSSAAQLGHLFRVLNQKSPHNRKGVFAGTRYVNGDLFREPAEIELEPSELAGLARAAEYDWRRVDPTIFGSLMEGVLGRERRWELGAHYTHEVDILRIVGPTIVTPWQSRIDACSSPSQARDLLDELCAFRVLDPACGCGNFLYVAYRELRRLEARLKLRIRDLAAEKGLPVPAGPWPYVPLANMHGLEIERVAVLIARARSASLDYVLAQGGTITDAVSSQRWPGEAKVHVSLVNWVNGSADSSVLLDGLPVPEIDASLRVGEAGDVRPERLAANRGHCFQGPIPVGAGFIVSEMTAVDLLSDRTVTSFART